MGIPATKKRFSWPKMMSDIRNYVRSCHSCQIYGIRLLQLPIEQSEIISRPFDKVSINIAGPLDLKRSRNNFILTMVDAATRWPKAVPLKGICTREVAEALFHCLAFSPDWEYQSKYYPIMVSSLCQTPCKKP
ncbi:gypsy retrotransposon integrase-like protein 1 [Plakobranchus ocellatus]|uniref:Gypsy retrotransposon integrase-like protein 1 n=1 Tax=Plakobranchus ocellatus TaxID=259542 RepID=A0AAV4BKY4_9GAST|nr:gypsy retrotransposon integrase-like protein 1 [Plakobranchus ocellatus]